MPIHPRKRVLATRISLPSHEQENSGYDCVSAHFFVDFPHEICEAALVGFGSVVVLLHHTESVAEPRCSAFLDSELPDAVLLTISFSRIRESPSLQTYVTNFSGRNARGASCGFWIVDPKTAVLRIAERTEITTPISRHRSNSVVASRQMRPPAK